MLLAGGKRENLIHCLNILYYLLSSQSNEKGVAEKNGMPKLPHGHFLAQKGHNDHAVDWAYSVLPNLGRQAG